MIKNFILRCKNIEGYLVSINVFLVIILTISMLTSSAIDIAYNERTVCITTITSSDLDLSSANYVHKATRTCENTAKEVIIKNNFRLTILQSYYESIYINRYQQIIDVLRLVYLFVSVTVLIAVLILQYVRHIKKEIK